ncbi:UNVERIFIED_CONTAM: hypothetical protein HDU68_011782 [Siphonaria sp. JEL0065]|nr:hypothetical protein HDU68_011782 [Siphonaria sp. JEL0065]
MLETVKEECMAAMMLEFLPSSDAVDDEDEEDEAKKTAFRKSMPRRSIRPSSVMMNPLQLQVPSETTKPDLKLRIRDMLVSKLASLSEVVIATLNLLCTAITEHPHRAIHFLIERLPRPETQQQQQSPFIDDKLLLRTNNGSPISNEKPRSKQPVPISTHTHLCEAEASGGKNSAGVSTGGIVRARANGIDLEELLLLGKSGGSKGNDVQRRKQKKRSRKTGWATLADATADDFSGVLKRERVDRRVGTGCNLKEVT